MAAATVMKTAAIVIQRSRLIAAQPVTHRRRRPNVGYRDARTGATLSCQPKPKSGAETRRRAVAECRHGGAAGYVGTSESAPRNAVRTTPPRASAAPHDYRCGARRPKLWARPPGPLVRRRSQRVHG